MDILFLQDLAYQDMPKEFHFVFGVVEDGTTGKTGEFLHFVKSEVADVMGKQQLECPGK